MFLKTIKSHKCNDEFIKRIFKSKELIKEKVGIDKAETMFYIGYFYFGEIFLYNKKLYIFSTNFEYDSQKKIIIDKQLLFEYNQNTAGWGWGETGFNIPPEKDTNRSSEVEALPFDLSIPDYRQLHSSC